MKWTKQQDDYLITNYRKLGASKCAKNLNKSLSSIYSRATTLNIQKNITPAKYPEIPRRIIAQVIIHAREKGRECTITEKDIFDQWIKQNKRCSLSGVHIQFHQKPIYSSASVDRIDCSKGYTPDNIQILHKDINLSKRIYSDDYFIHLCKLVADNRKDVTNRITEIEWVDDIWNDTIYPRTVLPYI